MTVYDELPGAIQPFRFAQPLAWTFHRNTARWLHNSFEQDDTAHTPEPPREHPEAAIVPLPDPADSPLRALLDQRRSCRNFSDEHITLPQLSTVLTCGYGTTGRSQLGALEFVERTVPSGGGLYPLELSLIVRSVDGLTPGVYHYCPLQNLVEILRDDVIPQRLVTYLFMGQPYAAQAACTIIISAVPGRSLGKYSDRGYRYLLLEAGHCAQNINLACLSLGLGSCNLGGFFDDELASLLGFDHDYELPLYGIAFGIPATPDPAAQRAIDQL